MAQSQLAPIAVRPRRALALMLPALALAVITGCNHHKRTSMRPVYIGPATTAPCPSGDCGSTVTPAAPPSATTSEPSLISPGSGSLAPAETPASATSISPPAPAAANTPPPVTGPSVSTPGEEPPLDLSPAEKTPSASPGPAPAPRGPSARPGDLKGASPGSESSPGPSASSSSPNGSLRNTSGRKSTPVRLRQASLRDRVEPFVNEPEDLFSPPKAERPWKYIVLHHSASQEGGYATIDREHRKRLGWDGCGYHFIIGNGTETADGRIEVSQRWMNQKLGVHCRDGKNPDVSEYGIGVCLVGDFEKSPPTPRQVAAARALVSYLSDRYKIAADHTETHAHLAASPTSCPGRLFPTKDILGPNGLALR